MAEDELDVRVIGPVRALRSPTPTELQRRVRPLRPGLSVAHPTVTAGTLGGFAGSSTGGLQGSGVTFANPLATVLAVLGAEWVNG